MHNAALFDRAMDALAYCRLAGIDPADEFGHDEAIDIINFASAYSHARAKETPGKIWADAEAAHPAIYRALGTTPSDDGAVYGCAAFRLYHSPDGYRILAAFPCPPLFDPDADPWLDIETVLAWDPVTDTAEVMGDANPQLVGRVPERGPTPVYGSPSAFLRAYVEARARWYVTWRSLDGQWQRRPAERDMAPGLLLLGRPDKVQWPIREIDSIEAHGLDPRVISNAMLRQARVPRAFAAQQKAWIQDR